MTRITYAYSDTAPIYGEHRAYADLPADAREWWDDILARLQAVADRAAELGAERRDAIIAAGIDGDLEMAVIAQERALAAAHGPAGAHVRGGAGETEESALRALCEALESGSLA